MSPAVDSQHKVLHTPMIEQCMVHGDKNLLLSLDCPITRTSYLPPVPARPGISIVCNKEHGKLSLTIGLIKGLLSGPETEELLTGLRSMLLSE